MKRSEFSSGILGLIEGITLGLIELSTILLNGWGTRKDRRHCLPVPFYLTQPGWLNGLNFRLDHMFYVGNS